MIKDVMCQSPLPFGRDLRIFLETVYKDRANAWINTSVYDHRDGVPGKGVMRSISIATSIDISRCAHLRQSRPIWRTLEKEIMGTLREMAG